jgi:hypothetical protein
MIYIKRYKQDSNSKEECGFEMMDSLQRQCKGHGSSESTETNSDLSF